MNIGVRFFKFNIVLPSAFFLSNLEPLVCLTSELSLPFDTVVRINALYYAKRDVFLSIHATRFLKIWVELSLLLSYNPLEIVNIMQPDHEGLGIWPLKPMSLCAGTVHTQSHHFASLPVLKARNSHLLSPRGTSQSPGSQLLCEACWRAASHNLYSRDKSSIDIVSIDINVTDQIR